MSNVLICPDKFKGTLDATGVAKAIAEGWRKARKGDAIELCPISDGGDGFGTLLSKLMSARRRRVRTVDAAHRPCVSAWWWSEHTKTAIIESAATIGLAMLPHGRFHPFSLDTHGLGKVLTAARQAGAKECLVGIGGSATNDGGFGLAKAMGYRFYGPANAELERWTELNYLKRIERPEGLALPRVTVAVDVKNPLLGSKGASRVYGPQKGLRGSDFQQAEASLTQLARIVGKDLGKHLVEVPGTGAAGGLGFGLVAFANATLTPGFDLFAAKADLKNRIQRADVVITGEGSIDESTLMGKGVGLLAKMCHRAGKPCIGLAGVVSEKANGNDRFLLTRALVDLTTPERALSETAMWVQRAAEGLALEFTSNFDGAG